MTTDAILTRLKENCAEITGVVRQDRLRPTKPIPPGDLPMTYAEPLGMVRPAPGDGLGAGQYVIPRRWRLTLLVAPTALVSFDESGEGSALEAQIIPFLDLFDDYFMRNPRLSTDAGFGNNSLNLERDISIQDGGPSIGPGPGGVNFGRIQFMIIVAERRFPTRKRLS